MSIAGNLNTMELTELLQWLSQGAKTGRLDIHNGKVEKQVYFRSGRIFSSSSSDPKEYLGHFLVSHGLITEMELAKAIEMQESNQMLLGKILVTIGAVSEPDLQRLLRLKAEESIYDIFSWEEAEFRFYDGEVPSSNLIPIDLDVTAIVLEGARRADEWRRIKEVIPGLQAIPVSVGPLDPADLDAGAVQILDQVNDDRTIEEICLQTHSGEYRVCQLLYNQFRQGLVKFVKPRLVRKEATGETPVDSSAVTQDGPITGETLMGAAEAYVDGGDFEPALRYLRAALSLEPENRDIKKALKEVENQVQAKVEEEGIRLTAIPKLTIALEELTSLDITPQEGFILTRVNGSYDLKSILKISPMQQLDGLLVIRRLVRAGHIQMA